jgi:hypothetical protein
MSLRLNASLLIYLSFWHTKVLKTFFLDLEDYQKENDRITSHFLFYRFYPLQFYPLKNDSYLY